MGRSRLTDKYIVYVHDVILEESETIRYYILTIYPPIQFRKVIPYYVHLYSLYEQSLWDYLIIRLSFLAFIIVKMICDMWLPCLLSWNVYIIC